MKCILWLLRLIITPLLSSSLPLLPSLLPFLPSPLPLPPPSMPYYLLILPSSPSVSFSPQFSHPLSSLPSHLSSLSSLLLPQMTLKDNGRVRLFKLGVASDEYAVVFTKEYIDHAKKHLGSTALCKKFVDVVLPACRDVSVTRNQLTDELRLSEEDIS